MSLSSGKYMLLQWGTHMMEGHLIFPPEERKKYVLQLCRASLACKQYLYLSMAKVVPER
jgi:hypothetical protein